MIVSILIRLELRKPRSYQAWSYGSKNLTGKSRIDSIRYDSINFCRLQIKHWFADRLPHSDKVTLRLVSRIYLHKSVMIIDCGLHKCVFAFGIWNIHIGTISYKFCSHFRIPSNGRKTKHWRPLKNSGLSRWLYE